jgi:hypothetical protein
MKINQLFIKKVELDTLKKLMKCYGLKELTDKHMFSKHDMIQLKTVDKIKEMKSELAQYYLPCKAKVYLEDINEKRAITILKQTLRLYGYHLQSKERNINGHKVIYYRLSNDMEFEQNPSMHKVQVQNIIYFD